MKKLIRKNNHGKLFYEIHKNEFHIECGTVQFTLPMDDYLIFERTLKELSNDISIYNTTKKIRIPVKSAGITLILKAEELLGLRNLFGFKTSKLVSFRLKINYSMN